MYNLSTYRRNAHEKETQGRNHFFFQPKLTINQPNDMYEQEADAVADSVVQSTSFFSPRQITEVQKKSSHAESDDSSKTENFVDSINGSRKLNNAERNFFEPRFGQDFSNVQLHTNSEANKSASDINARAYTHRNHIVFGTNQYQPNTDEGKKLMAHELTHIVQQQKAGGQIMRKPNPRPQSPADLSDYSEANRQNIFFDTENVTLNVADHFQKGIVEDPREGFDIDYVFTGSIDAWLQKPLRSISRAIFALQNVDTDAALLNKTLIKQLDLSPFHENDDTSKPAGPDSRFRFTCKEFDASKSGKQKTRNVQIIIDNVGAPQAFANASETDVQRITRFAKDYNFTRVDDTFFDDAAYSRVLLAMSRIPDALLRSVNGIPFNRVVGKETGPGGEAASYEWKKSGSSFTRGINIYDKAGRSTVTLENLAFLMTHEIGHAVAHRPAEATGKAAKADLANEQGKGSFREAATSDGGLAKAITVYGRTGWGEYFAEAFTMYINQPDTLRLLRPYVFAYFTTRFAPPVQPAQPAPAQP